jgi:hypothetical protein
MTGNGKIRAWEEGWTLTELLAAIGIMAAAGLIAARLLAPCAASLRTSQETLGRTAALIRADGLIREFAGTIAIPYWERQDRIIQGESSIEIPWYKGAADLRLILDCREAGLVMAIAGPGFREETVIGGFRVSALELIRGAEGLPFGLDLRGDFQGRDFRLTCAFGSFPLTGGGL